MCEILRPGDNSKYVAFVTVVPWKVTDNLHIPLS